MRWGISDEATNNHMAANICMNEIKNSQYSSIGPNFVVIIISLFIKSLSKSVNLRDY
jgi:hypothetical protein